MSVHCDRHGDVVVLTLHRPDRLNSLDDEMTGELLDRLEQISLDSSVGALILTGSGRAFTAGGDLVMLASRAREAGEREAASTGSALEKVMRENALVVDRLRELHCPSIAAINGACIGAGLAWAGACDLRLASDRALFDTAYLRLGLSTDFGVAWLLHDLLGTSVATDWLLRPRKVSAPEALSRGFIGQIIEDGGAGAVLDAALSLAQELQLTRAGVSAIRENLRDARQGTPLAAALIEEARRFVSVLGDPETAGRLASLGRVDSATG